LKTLAQAARTGAAPLADLETQAIGQLRALGWEPDYLTVRLRSDLQIPSAAELATAPLVALGAAKLGSTRLIDNLEF
ncbi:MAG: pantoate--beta-alanine ligase, partial [Comamonas sp.]